MEPIINLVASNIANILIEDSPLSLIKHLINRKSDEQKMKELVQILTEENIDPEIFSILLSQQMDRRLKSQFGYLFLILTALFTLISFAIIILNSIYKWEISSIAITGLIIETPLQFFGLLYIVARNLFPQLDGKPVQKKINAKKPKTIQEKPDVMNTSPKLNK